MAEGCAFDVFDRGVGFGLARVAPVVISTSIRSPTG